MAEPVVTPAVRRSFLGDEMSDERADYQTVTQGEPARPRPVDRRRSSGLMFALMIVLLVILGLLLLRGCASVQDAVSRRSATNQIVPVEGRTPIDGQVAVWLRAGADIQDVIRRSGVQVSSSVDMNGGRYVLNVKPGNEVEAARAIRGLQGVYDAGRVYEDTSTAK